MQSGVYWMHWPARFYMGINTALAKLPADLVKAADVQSPSLRLLNSLPTLSSPDCLVRGPACRKGYFALLPGRMIGTITNSFMIEQRDVNCGGIVVEFQDEDGQILRRAFFLQYGEIYLPDAKPSPWDSRADFNLLVSHRMVITPVLTMVRQSDNRGALKVVWFPALIESRRADPEHARNAYCTVSFSHLHGGFQRSVEVRIALPMRYARPLIAAGELVAFDRDAHRWPGGKFFRAPSDAEVGLLSDRINCPPSLLDTEGEAAEARAKALYGKDAVADAMKGVKLYSPLEPWEAGPPDNRNDAKHNAYLRDMVQYSCPCINPVPGGKQGWCTQHQLEVY